MDSQTFFNIALGLAAEMLAALVSADQVVPVSSSSATLAHKKAQAAL